MAVKINNNDLIEDAERVDLGNGNKIMPTRIVLHYSGGSTLNSAIATLKARKLSYNVLIDLDGSYHQARPFTQQSSHAGRSNWKAESGLVNGSSLNGSAIGISMINLGRLAYLIGTKWFYDKKNGQGVPPSIEDAKANRHALIYAPQAITHWTPYEPKQLDACRALVEAILARYPSITEIVGHHDIAIDDKPDPGPLWPLEEWRVALGKQGGLGLASKVKSADGVNLRERPNAEGKLIRNLPKDTVLHIRSVPYAGPRKGLVDGGSGRALTGWASVDIDGSNTHAGFVSMKFLTKTPLAASYAAQL